MGMDVLGTGSVPRGPSVGRKRSTLRVFAVLAILSTVAGDCELRETHIRIPTRPCAVEGSPQANGKSPGEVTSGPLSKRIDDAGDIFQAAGDLTFASPRDYLVIADPYPPDRAGELLGDVDDEEAFEPSDMAQECKEAWAEYDPQKQGTVIVNARAWTLFGVLQSTGGATPGVPPALHVDGSRGDDFCTSPRRLTEADVAGTSWTVVVDQDMYDRSPYRYWDPVLVLAHELGHTLMLGHGNGLDDNHDGGDPTGDGLRRFDEYCDPDGLSDSVEQIPVEDLSTPATTCETHSLMYYNASSICAHLSELQIEQARQVAPLVDGACMGAVCIEVVQPGG